MQSQQAYLSSLDLALRALDVAFQRLNAAERLRPPPGSRTLALTPPSAVPAAAAAPDGIQLDEPTRAELVAYDVAPDQWAARLALMSVWESLHAARGMAAWRASGSSRPAPPRSTGAWQQAARTMHEAARLAECAAKDFEKGARRAQRRQGVEPSASATT